MARSFRIGPPVKEGVLDRALNDAGARLGELYPGYLILGHGPDGRMWWRGRDVTSIRGMIERMRDRLRTDERLAQEDGGVL